MKEKLLGFLRVILTLGLIALYVYILFIWKDENNSLVIKLIFLAFGVVFAIVKRNAKPSPILYKKYEKAYKDFLAGAFVNDRESYMKLVEASIYWDKKQFEKAHAILDNLLSKCTCSKDYLVVYNVKAICYARARQNEPLVETYKEILKLNMTDSMIWSNLGWTYLSLGKTKEAQEAFTSAITYNPENANAYNNAATYYLKVANPEKALEYAKKAMELNRDLYQPMSTAAIASMMLGDVESADKYCELYVAKGGNKKKIDIVMAKLKG